MTFKKQRKQHHPLSKRTSSWRWTLNAARDEHGGCPPTPIGRNPALRNTRTPFANVATGPGARPVGAAHLRAKTCERSDAPLPTLRVLTSPPQAQETTSPPRISAPPPRPPRQSDMAAGQGWRRSPQLAGCKTRQSTVSGPARERVRSTARTPWACKHLMAQHGHLAAAAPHATSATPLAAAMRTRTSHGSARRAQRWSRRRTLRNLSSKNPTRPRAPHTSCHGRRDHESTRPRQPGHPGHNRARGAGEPDPPPPHNWRCPPQHRGPSRPCRVAGADTKRQVVMRAM